VANRSRLITDRFAPEATALRKAFETKVGHVGKADAQRFVWDWWHVPGQYTHLRTPAWTFFPQKIYDRFHQRLAWWGRENLGCHDVSPPWLSAYVDGCRQELHSDVPHGPWAFVFSLTPWKTRTFRGGNTLLMKADTLNFWQTFSDRKDYEADALVDRVPALFNRLTVFDPRIPHGVERVEGASGLLDARLVIHGWFVEPRPFIRGALPPARAEDRLGEFLRTLPNHLPLRLEQGLHGTLVLRISIRASGEVSKVEKLTDTLRVLGAGTNETAVSRAILRQAQNLNFGKLRGTAAITLPIQFR